MLKLGQPLECIQTYDLIIKVNPKLKLHWAFFGNVSYQNNNIGGDFW